MEQETQFTGQEKTLEQFPSKEEIELTFKALLQGKEYKELRLKSNDEGVYLYEVEVMLENGEKIEYNFQKATNNYRDKSLPTSAQFSASIHTTIYDTDGIPYDGRCVANYLDGVWSYVS